MSAQDTTNEALAKILAELSDLKLRNAQLESKVDALHGAATLPSPSFSSHARRQSGTGLSPLQQAINAGSFSQAMPSNPVDVSALLGTSPPPQPLGPPLHAAATSLRAPAVLPSALLPTEGAANPLPSTRGPTPNATPDFGPTNNPQSGYYSDRVILSTYPGQAGIRPLPMKWGAADPVERGVIVASRHPNSIKIRNAIGAYSGFYSVYRSLAIAMGKLNPNHRPDYTDTEPPFEIPYNARWSDPRSIVTLDPFGHLAPSLFKDQFDRGVDVRPTISMTKAHIKTMELDEACVLGRFPVDGKVVRKSDALPGVPADRSPGVEISVSKAAVEPVWFLPGVAERIGVSEGALRRALFEDTGGMYPELLTRPDLKVFLPPISGLTVYIFGPPEFLHDESKEVTVRVHDECNGSDVFGSDICTCRPYLIYGIEEAIKTAQRGGVGVCVYFRKEGRALGEVTKYLVYNKRKRGTDSAAEYFNRTSHVAGVEDMRFQNLGTPDILHWLGIKRIDNMISMSNLKHDAIVNAGIPIVRRYEIPPELIPADSQVEIEAKIHAGYFSNRTVEAEDLSKTVGRSWEDVDH